MTTDNLPQKNLGIGEIYVTTKAEQVSTVLGSCVSVCLYDSKNKISGMNHHMLPAPPLSVQVDSKHNGKYGKTALPELLDRMKALGMDIRTTSAKIFGGAHMLSQISFAMINERNVAVAREFLRENGIRIVAEDVGGDRGRKVIFQTDNGKVLVREVNKREFL
ncbi:MAG TPA: chemotaxis protein CheD [bacterium]|nr:chemotaxis protein CheD [bacterium]HPO07216.1 chemotaxis protein CheD [bacterium]HQP97669.1 chemotaxis protein CheD [bacterium]